MDVYRTANSLYIKLQAYLCLSVGTTTSVPVFVGRNSYRCTCVCRREEQLKVYLCLVVETAIGVCVCRYEQLQVYLCPSVRTAAGVSVFVGTNSCRCTCVCLYEQLQVYLYLSVGTATGVPAFVDRYRCNCMSVYR